MSAIGVYLPLPDRAALQGYTKKIIDLPETVRPTEGNPCESITYRPSTSSMNLSYLPLKRNTSMLHVLPIEVGLPFM